MFYSANGKSPQLSPTARIAQGARLVGQVQLMENSSVWYNAVLRADNAPITIGEGSNVQDNWHAAHRPKLPHHQAGKRSASVMEPSCTAAPSATTAPSGWVPSCSTARSSKKTV